ncbi:MAG: hypothetical protein R3E44_13775 [Paracoccaceae bacterium]
MPTRDPEFRPIRLFLARFLPGAGLALVLALVVSPVRPSFGPPLLSVLGLIVFARAVSSVACPSLGPRRDPMGVQPIAVILALRRHQLRYAVTFSLCGAAAFSLAGAALPVAFGAGAGALGAAVLFLVAWGLIGSTACSPDAIRKALSLALQEERF